MKTWLGAATLALMVSACAAGGATRNLAVDLVGSDATVAAAPGDTFSLRISENGSTGYEWERRDPLPDGVVELSNAYIQDAQEPDPSGAIMTGVGGTRVFTYRCDHATSGALSYKLFAPGDRVNAVEE
jgi:predicted secreted protein